MKELKKLVLKNQKLTVLDLFKYGGSIAYVSKNDRNNVKYQVCIELAAQYEYELTEDFKYIITCDECEIDFCHTKKEALKIARKTVLYFIKSINRDIDFEREEEEEEFKKQQKEVEIKEEQKQNVMNYYSLKLKIIENKIVATVIIHRNVKRVDLHLYPQLYYKNRTGFGYLFKDKKELLKEIKNVKNFVNKFNYTSYKIID